MPRLVGRQSSGGLSIGLLLLLSIAVLGTLEYVGTFDLIPNFGLERSDHPRLQPPSDNLE